MVKINLFSSLVLALSLTAGTTNAQNIWGVGAPVGAAEGEFSTAFVNATAAGSYSTTQWTALSIYDGNGAPGAAYWTRNLLGYSVGAYAGPTPMPSPSQMNGVAIFDSDFLDNDGTPNAFGAGTSPTGTTGHSGELISPRIDLTGYTNIGLEVQFFTQYRDYNMSILGVAMSVDDGATWSSIVDWRASIAEAPVSGFTSAVFKNLTQGVANLSQCRVKFVFEGDYYFAMVDDVTIKAAPAYQIAMGNADAASNLLVGSGNSVKISGNRYMPLTFIDNLGTPDFREWFWGGKVVNKGTEDLLPSDSAALHVRIDYVNPNTGVITPSVYTDVMYIDTVYGSDLSGRTEIDYLKNLDFIKNNGAGDYRVTYWATHKNNTSTQTSDDTVKHVFTMTDKAGAANSPLTQQYLSKARLSTADGKVGYTRSISSATAPAAMEYGSVFFFPRGASDAITIDSVDFRYRVGPTYTGGSDQTLLCSVYEIDASSSAVLNDDAVLTQVGLGVISLTGLVANTYGLHTINNIQDPSFGGPMAALKDNGFYYVSIINDPGQFGGAATLSPETGVQMCVDESNMYLNAAMTAIDSIINPSPLNSTAVGGAVTRYWTGFGAGYLPSLGIYVSSATIVNTTSVFADAGTELTVYPNPTSDVLNVNFKLDEASDVMYIITDMSGRVVSVLNSANVTNDTQSINVSNLASGVYMITAKTDKLSSTERFVKR